MLKITLKIEGMACGMCENHINNTIRTEIPNVKKVSSSHAKGETIIISDTDISDELLHNTINPTGYTVLTIQREPYKKKGLFHFGKK